MMHVPAYIDPDHQSSPVIVDNCEIDPLLVMGIARARTIYSYWCLQFPQGVIGYDSASLVHRASCLMLEVRKLGSGISQALAAQARGVLGLTPGNCSLFTFLISAS